MSLGEALAAFALAFMAVMGALAAFSAARSWAEVFSLPPRHWAGSLNRAALDTLASCVLLGASLYLASLGA